MFRSVRLVALFAAVLFLSLVVGCGPPQNPVIGTWTGPATGMEGEEGRVFFTFNPDGTMIQSFKAGSRSYEIKGTYTAKEGRMTQTLKSYTINGKTSVPPSSTREVGYVVNGPEMVIGITMSENVKLKKVE